MLTAQDNATLVRAHIDAYNRRDFDKGLAMVSDDVTLSNIPFSLTFTGKKGFREYLDNWATAMTDSKVEIVNVIGGEEWLAVECIGRGTHTGPFAGPQGRIPPTQKKVELRFCQTFLVNDGLITKSHIYFDGATLMRQLGVMPAQLPGQPVPAGH
jgi:steroid delta-isomerase-like uncharacterized protein